MVEELHGSTTDIGIAMGVFSVSAVLIRPFVGYALDKYGRRGLQIVSLLMLSLVHASFLLAASIAFLFVIRFIHGIPWGIGQTAVSTVAADLIPEERRGEGLGFFGLTFTLSGAIGPFISLALLDTYNFEVVFITGTVLSFLGIASSFLTRFPQIEMRHHAFTLRSMIAPSVLGVSLGTLLCTMSYGAVISFITLFVQEYQLPSAGWYFALASCGTVVTRIRSGILFDRYGPKIPLIIGLSSLVLSLITLGSLPTTVPYLISAFFLGAGFGISVPTWQAMAINLVPVTKRGTASATLFSAFDIGIACGSLGLGALVSLTGLRVMFLIEGFLLLVPFALFLFIVIPKYHLQMNRRTT